MNVYAFLVEGWTIVAECVNEFQAHRIACLLAGSSPDEGYGYGDDEDSITEVVINYK